MKNDEKYRKKNCGQLHIEKSFGCTCNIKTYKKRMEWTRRQNNNKKQTEWTTMRVFNCINRMLFSLLPHSQNTRELNVCVCVCVCGGKRERERRTRACTEKEINTWYSRRCNIVLQLRLPRLPALRFKGPTIYFVIHSLFFLLSKHAHSFWYKLFISLHCMRCVFCSEFSVLDSRLMLKFLVVRFSRRR